MNEQEKNEWLLKRRSVITGTDIASIIGVSKYGSPMTVFLDKLGLSEPLAENESMYWGKALEPVVAARYALDNKIDLVQGEFIKRDEIFGGTPDYLSPTHLVEIKTAGQYSAKFWGEVGSDQIPENFLCQVQWYLMLTDREVADVVVLIGGQDYRVYRVIRNQALISLLKDSAVSFWEKHIVPQTPPDIDATQGSKDYLKVFFPKSRGELLNATKASCDLVERLIATREQIEALDAEKTLLENRIKLLIGDNDGIIGENFRITWRSSKNATKVDWEAIARTLDVPDETKIAYTKTSQGSRRFLIDYNN